jgi:hypothetical protein
MTFAPAVRPAGSLNLTFGGSLLSNSPIKFKATTLWVFGIEILFLVNDPQPFVLAYIPFF